MHLLFPFFIIFHYSKHISLSVGVDTFQLNSEILKKKKGVILPLCFPLLTKNSTIKIYCTLKGVQEIVEIKKKGTGYHCETKKNSR